MRHRRSRAFTLTQVLVMLPLAAAITTVVYELTVRTLWVQGREHQVIQDEAKIQDVIRRVQHDAAGAERAAVEKRGEAGTALTLHDAEATVIYEAAGSHLTRIERAAGQPDVSYDWTFAYADVTFAIEPAAPSRAIVWITVTSRMPMDQGPDHGRLLSAAAIVGRGGAS